MDKPTLTFGSLFAGIGGIDLGLERAGMECAWQVEIDDYATKVLAKHWPNTPRFRDVRSIGRHIGDIHTCYLPVSPVDVLAGGFPCQPHSQAGERKASSDERDLWPEFHRLIRELKPRWVVAENVLGLLSSEDGAFFGGVLRDLAACGYDARWQVLSAAQFGAPHLRERVIIVAHHPGIGSGAWGTAPAGQQRATIAHGYGPANLADTQNKQWDGRRDTWNRRDRSANSGSPLAYPGGPEWWASAEKWGNVADWTNAGWQEAASGSEFCCEELAHAGSQGLSECGVAWGIHQATDGGASAGAERRSRAWSNWDTRAVESGMGRATSRVPVWLDGYRWPAGPGQQQYEWEASRVTTEKVANRASRLKGLGNAVVPVLAEYVGRCIVAAEAESECVA